MRHANHFLKQFFNAKSRVMERGGEKEFFHLLIQFPNGYNGQAQDRVKHETPNSTSDCHVHGRSTLVLSSAASADTLAGCWIGSRTALI